MESSPHPAGCPPMTDAINSLIETRDWKNHKQMYGRDSGYGQADSNHSEP